MNADDVQRLEAKGKILTLRKALGDRDPQVRRQACLSLGNLGAVVAVVELTDHLVSDADGHVRSAAARSLERIRDARAVPRLVWSLENDPDDFVRKCAASALGNIRDESAIPALQKAADPVTHPRSIDRGESFGAAAKALARFGRLPAGDSSMEFTRFGVPEPSRAAREAALPEVVGESFYQEALARAAQAADWGDQGWLVAAQFCAEPTNLRDPNAVRVTVRGETVGYLSRSDAPRFAAALLAQGPLDCRVEIRGERRLGAFVVALVPLLAPEYPSEL